MSLAIVREPPCLAFKVRIYFNHIREALFRLLWKLMKLALSIDQDYKLPSYSISDPSILTPLSRNFCREKQVSQKVGNAWHKLHFMSFLVWRFLKLWKMISVNLIPQSGCEQRHYPYKFSRFACCLCKSFRAPQHHHSEMTKISKLFFLRCTEQESPGRAERPWAGILLERPEVVAIWHLGNHLGE